jgi:hypothetical protein
MFSRTTSQFIVKPAIKSPTRRCHMPITTNRRENEWLEEKNVGGQESP